MEVELMVTKRDDNQPTDNRVNIEQSASGRLEGRVLQYAPGSNSKWLDSSIKWDKWQNVAWSFSKCHHVFESAGLTKFIHSTTNTFGQNLLTTLLDYGKFSQGFFLIANANHSRLFTEIFHPHY